MQLTSKKVTTGITVAGQHRTLTGFPIKSKKRTPKIVKELVSKIEKLLLSSK